MNKQTIIGIVIIFAIFLLSEQFLWKKTKAAAAKQDQQEQIQPETTLPTTETTTPDPEQGLPDFFTEGDDFSEVNDNIVLENDSLKIVFSSKGAVVREIYLKQFTLSDKSVVQLIPEGNNLVNTVLLTDTGSTDLKNITFDYREIEEKGQRGILFSFAPEPDRIIEKKFVLDYNYGVNFNLKVHSVYSISGYSVEFDSGINDTEDYIKNKAMDYKFFSQVDNLLEKKDLRKLMKNSLTLSGKVEWAAIRSKYFTLACKDIEPVLVNSVKADTSSGSPIFTLTAKRDKASLDWDEDFLLYFGPANVTLLQAHGSGMENIAERGAKWLRWLVNIFAWFLSFLYRLIPNYGIVIIVFSIILKIVLHPLTHKSMDASLKMQKIQPQVQAIQKQYKSDPKRLQQELSKLYKEAGASPLGGCLPLLFQMPVFFALYSVLRFSLDMRQAYFVGWLKDLSEPDPYWILPILMGVFMVIQQLMMKPNKKQLEQMDEKQQAMQQSQKLMAWIMPVFLFFIFKSMPAGLVLYWTVFNILSIIQQYYLQKHLNKKDFQ